MRDVGIGKAEVTVPSLRTCDHHLAVDQLGDVCAGGLRGHTGRVKMRPPTDTSDGEITLRPHGDVARVGSGVDFDRVSSPGAAGGPAG